MNIDEQKPTILADVMEESSAGTTKSRSNQNNRLGEALRQASSVADIERPSTGVAERRSADRPSSMKG
jgi:hypothetical protein